MYDLLSRCDWLRGNYNPWCLKLIEDLEPVKDESGHLNYGAGLIFSFAAMQFSFPPIHGGLSDRLVEDRFCFFPYSDWD